MARLFFPCGERQQDIPYDDGRESAQSEDDQQRDADYQEDIADLIVCPREILEFQ